MKNEKKTTKTRSRRYAMVAEEKPVVADPGVSDAAGRPRVIGATEAARRFSDIINRVRYRGETYIVERGGHPMCEMRPARTSGCTGAELRTLLARLGRAPDEFLDAVEEASRNQANVAPSPWE